MRYSLLLCFVSLFCLSFGQNSTRITVQSRNGNTAYCGFNLENGFNSDSESQYLGEKVELGHSSGIPDVISEILDVCGIDVEIRVYIIKDENNCFATIAQGGIRVIMADHSFLNDVNELSDTDWAAISILAHEVGHHIAGFNRSFDQKDNELDADYWSGYILHKLGASREAAIKCIMTFGTEYDSTSHPNKYSRSQMIQKGWDDSYNGQTDYSKCESCAP